jgi:hypothetical protein
MRLLLQFVVALLCATTAAAQDDDDEALYANWGFNLGWSYAKPSYPGLEALKERYDANTAFLHEPMQPGTYSSGGAFGLSFFSGRSAFSFDYHALGLTNTYRMESAAGEGLKDYSFKLYQHTGRWSYGYGIPWAKHGVCGIYAGAGIYFGTWDVKWRKPLDEKMKSTNIEDLKGLSLGLSPELTLRLFFLEIKAFYDYPLLKTDLAPVYNYLYGQAGAPSASGDSKLKTGLSNLGVCATVFIPFGKPSPVSHSGGTSGSGNDRDAREREQMKRDSEQNQKRVQENERSIRDYQRSNERRHEQERRDQYNRR